MVGRKAMLTGSLVTARGATASIVRTSTVEAGADRRLVEASAGATVVLPLDDLLGGVAFSLVFGRFGVRAGWALVRGGGVMLNEEFRVRPRRGLAADNADRAWSTKSFTLWLRSAPPEFTT